MTQSILHFFYDKHGWKRYLYAKKPIDKKKKQRSSGESFTYNKYIT